MHLTLFSRECARSSREPLGANHAPQDSPRTQAPLHGAAARAHALLAVNGRMPRLSVSFKAPQLPKEIFRVPHWLRRRSLTHRYPVHSSKARNQNLWKLARPQRSQLRRQPLRPRRLKTNPPQLRKLPRTLLRAPAFCCGLQCWQLPQLVEHVTQTFVSAWCFCSF